MNKNLTLPALIFTFLFSFSCSMPGGKGPTVFLMKTSAGDIKIMLYDETPLHRDNFIKLINSGFYEGISFHRVINTFMVQAGDPLTRTQKLPSSADSLSTYTIPAEFVKTLFHKKGALAAAREGNNVNPDMRSSGTQFYLVQGTLLNDEELDLAEQRINSNLRQAMFNKFIHQVADSASATGNTFSDSQIQERASTLMFKYLTENPEYKIPPDQREVYKSQGGVPRLDGTYTVFGEVIEGLEVIDRIASAPTDNSDKPINDIKILKIRIIN